MSVYNDPGRSLLYGLLLIGLAHALKPDAVPADAGADPVVVAYHASVSLLDLELDQSAVSALTGLVRDHPDHPIVGEASRTLLRLCASSSDLPSLGSVAGTLVAHAERDRRGHIAALRAEQLVAEGRADQALALLAQVSPRDPGFGLARYVEGTIFAAQGSLKLAVEAYREVVLFGGASFDSDDWELGQLALYRIAQVYVDLGRQQNARDYLSMVDVDSAWAADARVEAAWIDLSQTRADQVPDLLRGIRGWAPGAVVLRAAARDEGARRRKAQRAADWLDGVEIQLAVAVRSPPHRVAASLDALPRALRQKILAEPEVAATTHRLAQIDAELDEVMAFDGYAIPAGSEERLREVARKNHAEWVEQVQRALDEEAREVSRWRAIAEAVAEGRPMPDPPFGVGNES